MLRMILVLLTALSWTSVSAQAPGRFINPPNAGQQLYFDENLVFTVGNTLQARWTTTLEQYSIWLWQQSLTASSGVLGLPIYNKIAGGPEQGAFNWTASLQTFDLLQSNVFFLALGPTQDITSKTVTSHYFNSTASNAQLNSSSPTSTTGISSSSTISTSAPTTTTSNSTEGDHVNSNTTAKKIGLGVGIGVGILALLLLGTYFFGRLRRQRRQKKIPVSKVACDVISPIESRLKQDDKSIPPQELDADDQDRHKTPHVGNTRTGRSGDIAELGG